MADMTEVERFEPYTDEGNREGYGQMEPCEGGDWVRATDYDALAAKLATCEKYRDAYAECDRIGTQAVRDLEAKLAEVEAERDRFAKRHEKHLVLGAEARTRAEAAEAKLAEVTDDCDDLQIALASARKQLERYIAEAEAALVAVYRLALEKCEAACQIEIDRGDKNNASAYAVGARSCQSDIRALPTPTAAELMARINEGEKK